jgi:hypothetical protein
MIYVYRKYLCREDIFVRRVSIYGGYMGKEDICIIDLVDSV